MADLKRLPEPKFSDRGFQYVLTYKDNSSEQVRLVSQSSAIDFDYEGNGQPGSSYLWVGDVHLDREEVAEFISMLQLWLETGYLKDPDETEWMDR